MTGTMVGRIVESPYHGHRGEVIRWEPLSHAMCDVLVRTEDGREVWFGSGDLRPLDGMGEFPSRRAAVAAAEAERDRSLRAIADRWEKAKPVPKFLHRNSDSIL